MWHRVAPVLSRKFTLVLADLRGYGDSAIPAPETAPASFAKSAMGRDMREVMAALGYARFAVLAHDRGARVAYRMMLDQPDAVDRAVLLDIIPTLDVWESFASPHEALTMSHWTFLAQPSPLPEDLISANPDRWLESRFARGAKKLPGWLDANVYAAYRRAHADPARRAAHCNDYRAGATVDLEADRLSRANDQTISASLMVLWGARGNLAKLHDPLSMWRRWCPAAEGGAIDSGHYIPEENPDALLPVVLPFLLRHKT